MKQYLSVTGVSGGKITKHQRFDTMEEAQAHAATYGGFAASNPGPQLDCITVNGQSLTYDTTEADIAEATKASNEYQRLRREEYPPVGDQLDALWKGGQAAADMKAIIDGVKAKHPKP